MNEIPRRSWWNRNWKWCVPVLCVFALGTIAAAIFAFASFVFGMMRSSTPYQEAMQRVRLSPTVAAALGTPIEAGYLFSGSMSNNGIDGGADFTVALQGPKGRATLHVRAEMRDGVWHYTLLTVTLGASGKPIDLLRAQDGPTKTQAATNTSFQASAASCSTIMA